MKNRTTHYFKPMLCGAWGCVRASVLAFLKQGSSLQQYLIAVVVETAEVYAKMAHNVCGLGEGGLVGCSNLAECVCPLLPNPCYMKCRLI